MKLPEKISNPGYTIEFIDVNTILTTIDGTKTIDLNEAKKLKVIALNFCNNKPFKNIVNFGNHTKILTTEAKEFIASDKDYQRLKICDALITNSLVTTLLIGVYTKFLLNKTPTKTFSNFKDANDWVNTF